MKKIILSAAFVCVLAALAVLYFTLPVYSSPHKPVTSYEQLRKELAEDSDIVLPRESTLDGTNTFLVALNGRSRSADAIGYSISGTTEQEGVRRFYARACDEGQQPTDETGELALRYEGTDIFARVTDLTTGEDTVSITLWNGFSVGNHTYWFSDTYSVSSADAERFDDSFVETKANELLEASCQLIDDHLEKN